MKLDGKIYKILFEKNVNFLISGPSIAFNSLIDLIEENQQLVHIPIIREDEAIGIASGLFTGGKKSIIIINEMGLGNLINAIKLLSNPYKIPLIFIITPPPDLGRSKDSMRNTNLGLIDHFNIKKWKINSIKELDNLSEAIDYFDTKGEIVAIIFESFLEGME